MTDTLSGIKYDETTNHTHMQAVSAESQISEISKLAVYLLSLPPGSAIIINDVSHRDEVLVD
jgi:hypothetical protein